MLANLKIGFTYISEFFVPSTKHMAFEWNREIILWDPVIEDALHVRIVRVDVEHEAGQTIPPLDVVHHGDLVPVVALEDRLGAADVVHHVVAGSQMGPSKKLLGGRLEIAKSRGFRRL